MVPQHPSPDLRPCDIFLFPNLKNFLNGRHFGTLENTQKSVTNILKTIPIKDFQRCYQKWNYFEGDNIDV